MAGIAGHDPKLVKTAKIEANTWKKLGSSQRNRLIAQCIAVGGPPDVAS